MNDAFLAFTLIFVLFGCLSMYVVVHELTHLMGATNPKGICIGLCGKQPPLESRASVVGMAFADKYLFGDEVIPTLTGFIATGTMLVGWIYVGRKEREVAK